MTVAHLISCNPVTQKAVIDIADKIKPLGRWKYFSFTRYKPHYTTNVHAEKATKKHIPIPHKIVHTVTVLNYKSQCSHCIKLAN